MIEHLPNWINLLFILTTIATIVLFYLANNKPLSLIIVLLIWSIGHSILAYNGFYHNVKTVPPRFALVLIPSALLIIYGVLPKQIKWMIENRNTKISTLLHSIRIPVEIVLLYLFIHEMIPQSMTFEGINFDIVAGITAVIIGLLNLKGKVSKNYLLIWNVFGLILISIILFVGVLSAELPIQQFSLDKPSTGLNYFPFVLLPGVLVPIVIYTHITDIIKLRRELKASQI